MAGWLAGWLVGLNKRLGLKAIQRYPKVDVTVEYFVKVEGFE